MTSKRAKERVSVSCSKCGRSETCAKGGIPAGWSLETEGKRILYTCPECLRVNLRALEAKLPQEYWEW